MLGSTRSPGVRRICCNYTGGRGTRALRGGAAHRLQKVVGTPYIETAATRWLTGTLSPKLHPVASAEKTVEADAEIDRHRTAIDRDQLSAPMKFLVRHGYLSGDYTVLDYGCGKGHDVLELEAHGIDVVGWDPMYRPDGKLRASDISQPRIRH